MGFDLGSGFSGIDLSGITQGSDQAVLPDVAYGGPAEQPTDPTGNGFGQFINGASSFLDKAMNYALQRDAMQMQMDYATATRQPQYRNVNGVQQRPVSNNGLLLMLGVGAVIFLAVKA